MPTPSPHLLEKAQAAQAAFRSDPDNARALANEVLSEAGPQDGLAQARALLVLTKLSHRATKYAESIKFCHQALELARAEDEAKLIADGLNILGLSQHALGNNRVALEHFQDTVRIAEAADDHTTAIRAIANTAMVMHAQGDKEACLAQYEKLISNPHVQADDMLSAQIRHNFAQTSWDLGRELPRCAEYFALSATHKRKLGDRWSLSLTLCSLPACSAI